mmetsp:Transcript_59963/g.172085  ORF Transcript_59963/g.172085 Transcript_59963/m.172085 type:complete len:305 (+) Transcript_59963:301-1215(+)
MAVAEVMTQKSKSALVPRREHTRPRHTGSPGLRSRTAVVSNLGKAASHLPRHRALNIARGTKSATRPAAKNSNALGSGAPSPDDHTPESRADPCPPLLPPPPPPSTPMRRHDRAHVRTRVRARARVEAEAQHAASTATARSTVPSATRAAMRASRPQGPKPISSSCPISRCCNASTSASGSPSSFGAAFPRALPPTHLASAAQRPGGGGQASQRARCWQSWAKASPKRWPQRWQTRAFARSGAMSGGADGTAPSRCKTSASASSGSSRDAAPAPAPDVVAKSSRCRRSRSPGRGGTRSKLSRCA